MSVQVMTDLETLSSRKDACVVQIAAIAFDSDTGVEVAPPFNVYVHDLTGHVDLRTIAWWLQQRAAPALGAALDAVARDQASLPWALSSLSSWYCGLECAAPIWAHGATFDLAILSYHYAAQSLRQPWRYDLERDTRTLFELAGGRPSVALPDGIEHDALYDCRLQAAQVVAALRVVRSGFEALIKPGSPTAGDQLDSARGLAP